MNHLKDEQLSAFLDGSVSDATRDLAERHLAECADCRARLESFASLDQLLAPALKHDPGEAYFEHFAERVNERIAAAAAAGEGTPADEHAAEITASTTSTPPHRVRRSPLAALIGLLSTPRGLAWAGGVAVLVVGGGIVLMTARETPVPSLRSPAIEQRANQTAAPENAVRRLATPSADEAEAPAPAEGLTDQDAARTEDEMGEGLGKRGGAPQSSAQALQPLQSKDDVTAGTSAPAAPSRAVEVRRDAHGEEIPVQRPGAFAAPPAAQAPAKEKKQAPATTFPKPVATPAKTEEQRESSPAEKGAVDALQKPANEPEAAAPLGGAADAAKSALTRTGRDAARAPISLETQSGAGAQVCGEVHDAAGRPIVGAQVAIANLGRTSTTDARGRFCIATPAGRHEISVLAIGFEPARRTVEVAGTVEEAFALKAVSVLGDFALNPSLYRTGGKIEWPVGARALVERARQRSDQAGSQRSAVQFDQAANDWERVLTRAGQGQPALEARYRAAEARYRAWDLDPTPERARSAQEALTTFLARAPQGAARDSASRWLERLKQ